MDYPQPTLITPEEASTYYCPFGCKAAECDDRGYCPHLVGFTTDREVLEPIEELLRYSSDKGAWYTTGFYSVNATRREMVQPEDKIINPIKREKLPKSDQEYDRYLWVSFRVYTEDPDREPIPFEAPVSRGARAWNVNFSLKAREKRLEQQMGAPPPDADIEVNPRKRARVAANKKAAQANNRRAKRRTSTAETAAGADPADSGN